MKYRFLLFDADNTILDFSRCEKEILMDIAARFGLPMETIGGESIVEAYRRHNTAVWHELEEGTMDPATIKVERFRRWLQELNPTTVHRPIPPERLNREFITQISQCSHLVPTARSLLEAYAPVVLITNGFADVQHSRIDKAGIREFFQHIFISEEIGAAKPQPDFFNAVLSRLGSPDPTTCLVIGDSLNSDIRGGNQAGMDTCWFDRRPSDAPLADDAPRPTYHVRRLSKVREIIDAV